MVLDAPAGHAFLFDVSGVHRQTVPVLTARDAVFIVFHDPSVPLQAADVAASRYRPALVPVDALDGMTPDQLRLLGVGRRELRDAMRPPSPVDPGWRAALARAEVGGGRLLIEGKAVTGFTREEEVAMSTLEKVPLLLEELMIEQGATYQKKAAWSVFVVEDGQLITGQNPPSAKAVGEALARRLA